MPEKLSPTGEVLMAAEQKRAYDEGRRFFDIKFTVKIPISGEYIHLIINLEAQKNFSPGYSIIKRGVYYCCRLISSQYGTVFTKSS